MIGIRHFNVQQLLMLDELLPKNQGATKEMINNKTSIQQYHKSDNHENDNCIICITDFEENEGIRFVRFLLRSILDLRCHLGDRKSLVEYLSDTVNRVVISIYIVFNITLILE